MNKYDGPKSYVTCYLHTPHHQCHRPKLRHRHCDLGQGVGIDALVTVCKRHLSTSVRHIREIELLAALRGPAFRWPVAASSH